MVVHSTARSLIATVGLTLAAAATLTANGQEFFPAGNGPVDLVYFGIIKDAETGRPVRDHAYITVKDTLTGMSVPFTGDKPGHYRTPDIGALIKELGEVADPKNLEMTLVVPGYRKVQLARMPRKAAGAIEVSFKLERDGTALTDNATGFAASAQATDSALQTAASPVTESTEGTSGLDIAIGMFIAVVGLTAIAGVGRTLVRRPSTDYSDRAPV